MPKKSFNNKKVRVEGSKFLLKNNKSEFGQ